MRWRRVQKNALLQLSMKKVELGSGPGASLYLYGLETLRFDLFGKGGHYHLHVAERERKRLPPERYHYEDETTAAQIERASRDLVEKLGGWLLTSENEKIRAFKPDREHFLKAAEWMRETLLSYIGSSER